MTRIASLALALSGIAALAACGDDTVKPGTIVVKWNHGPTSATCATRMLANIEARALKNDEEVASASGTCAPDAKSGTINIPNLAPGTYAIEVEGFTAASKGTYLGTLAKQNVGEGKTVETSEIVLGQKPAMINVDWNLPGGGRCSSAGIAEIEVYLYYEASTVGTPIGQPQRVACESTGMSFNALVPNPDAQLIGFGYDSAKKKIARAETTFFPLEAGDELTKVLSLTLCPGTPPNCD
jgi:hypothetical protein